MPTQADNLPIKICQSRLQIIFLLITTISLSAIIVPLCLVLIYGTNNSVINLFIKPLLWASIFTAPSLTLILLYLFFIAAKRCVEVNLFSDGGALIKSAKGDTHKINKVYMIKIQKVSLLRPGYHQYFVTIVGDGKEVPLGVAMSMKKINKMAAPVAELAGTNIETSNHIITIFDVFSKYR